MARFESTTQPLCRGCGKPIPKRTITVLFGRSAYKSDRFYVERTEKPTSKAEAQRAVNEQIVSIRWNQNYDYVSDKRTKDYIDKVTVWDGLSYIDEFFCKGACAMDLGYGAARAGQVMEGYNQALAARRG